MKLELNDVKKSYGDKSVIHGLNLVFEHGIYGFLGPNGAGKSTTIRMLCTVDVPDSGSIHYNGLDIYKMAGNYRDKIGYVPQKPGYYPDFSAFTFLKYIAALKGLENEEKIIEESLKNVGLWEVRNKKLREFSGGMKQRVNIAQALLNNPEILILDEPTVGLDPDERMNLKNLVADFAENKIIIFATHIVSDVEDIADNVIILNNGSIKLNEKIDTAMMMTKYKVWECDLKDINEINRIKDKYKVSRLHRHNGVTGMRIISDEKPCEGAVETTGSLEEVYLDFIENDRNKTDEKS